MFVSVVAVTCARCTRLAQHTARGRMSRPGTQNIFRVCLTTNSQKSQLDLSRLGHNGLVHNAREDSWQLNERQPQVQSEGWHWVAIGHS